MPKKSQTLVVVESPAKAKKLTSYLGKDYLVAASVGHIRDLPKKELGVDIEHNFKPKYVISPGKSKVIKQLRQLAKQTDQVILATDPDREGEAIAWHIMYVLKKEVPADRFSRAVFYEITKPAVLKAIEHPGDLNLDLVNAQQARRVLDRLVGYKISPVLWRKVRRGLSAGRVQSVALRLVVEREKEIEAFKPEEYWEIYVGLSTQKDSSKQELFKDQKLPKKLEKQTLVAQLTKVEGKNFTPKTQAEVEPVLSLLEVGSYQVSQVEKKERKRQAPPPLITSTMQQAAATLYGFSARQTMRLAQDLYEAGYITYHRTDSFNLSQQAIKMARDYIAGHFGTDYLPEKPNFFKSKSKTAQEAHEAIRVTDVKRQATEIVGGKFGPRHQKLYQLIFNRFLASQMTPAVYDQTKVIIEVRNPELKSVSEDQVESISESNTKKPGISLPTSATLTTSGSVVKFAGWTVLTGAGEDKLLPQVETGQELAYLDKLALQKFTQPPARYNDASLVKELEKRGIGRPSTYASIISVIVERGYVERKQKRFFATPVGVAVAEFLLKNFPEVMAYEFTAQIEDELDEIALGKRVWTEVVKKVYTPIAKKIDQVLKEAKRVEIPVEKTGQVCPECGQGEIVIRSGKFGKFKSCSRFPECKYTENIVETLADVKCPLCGKGDVVVKNTRWGKPFYGCSRYPECDWASWQKPEPGLKLTQDQWQMMQAERKERAKKRKARWAKKKKKK